MTENEEQELQALAARAASLTTAVGTLNTEVGNQVVKLSAMARFNRRMIWALMFGFFIQVILAVMVIVNLTSINNVTERLNEVQRIQQEEVLCPLYQIFINSDTAAARERAAKEGRDLKEREESFKVIRESYAALECHKFKK